MVMELLQQILHVKIIITKIIKCCLIFQETNQSIGDAYIITAAYTMGVHFITTIQL